MTCSLKDSKWFKTEKIVHIFSCMFIVVFCCINWEKLNYIAVLNDEFGYWANAASMAGYHWSDLIAETPYYSWGYSIWLVPIMLIIKSPEVWYKMAIVLNMFFLMGTYFLANATGKRLFKGIDSAYICFTSFITAIYPSNIVYAQVAWSETLLYFLVWLETYILVLLDEKFTYKKFVSAIGLLIYMYAVHTRMIGIIGVGIFCLFLILIKHRKKIWDIIVLLASVGFGYILLTMIKGICIEKLWGDSAVSSVNNVNIDVNTISSYFERIIYNVRLLIESLGGKFIYLIIATGMIISVSFFVTIKDQILNIKNKRWFAEYGISKIWSVLILIVMWGLCAVQMLGWETRKDIIVYSRYMENAIGPMLFLGIIYLLYEKKIVRVSVILSFILLLFGMRSVYLRIEGAQGNFNSICSPIFGGYIDWFENNLLACIVIMLVMLLWVIVMFSATYIGSKQKKSIYIVSMLVILFALTGFNSNRYMNSCRDYFYDNTVPITEIVRLEDQSCELYYVKNIATDEYSVYPKYLQFTVPEKNIVLIEKEDIKNLLKIGNAIILVNPRDIGSVDYISNVLQLKCVESTSLLNVYKSN